MLHRPMLRQPALSTLRHQHTTGLAETTTVIRRRCTLFPISHRVSHLKIRINDQIQLWFTAENVFMYEQPPPYPGMGPVQPNPPPPGFYPNLDGGNQQPQPNVTNSSASAPPYQAPAANNWAPYPSQPPSYNQATTLPQKAHMD
jgi:hypothetical protein